MDEFFPTWHKFQNCVAVEIGLPHSQPVMKNHFNFLVNGGISDLPGVVSVA
jgi:hypothetical protein